MARKTRRFDLSPRNNRQALRATSTTQRPADIFPIFGVANTEDTILQRVAIASKFRVLRFQYRKFVTD